MQMAAPESDNRPPRRARSGRQPRVCDRAPNLLLTARDDCLLAEKADQLLVDAVRELPNVGSRPHSGVSPAVRNAEEHLAGKVCSWGVSVPKNTFRSLPSAARSTSGCRGRTPAPRPTRGRGDAPRCGRVGRPRPSPRRHERYQPGPALGRKSREQLPVIVHQPVPDAGGDFVDEINVAPAATEHDTNGSAQRIVTLRIDSSHAATSPRRTWPPGGNRHRRPPESVFRGSVFRGRGADSSLRWVAAAPLVLVAQYTLCLP